MKIAILGGGFAGLATAWELLDKKKYQITLFDPFDSGGQASSVSAGLLHTYVGLHAKYNLYGHEGYEATLRLLQIASEELPNPVYGKSGLLRPAVSEEQKHDFMICAEKYQDTEWISAEQAQRMVKGVAFHPALWIKSAITVYPELYMKGLGQACLKRGMHLEKKTVENLKDLTDYDAIIVAAGPQTANFPELSLLPLNLIKGQILEAAWPNELPPLPMPVNAQAYIVMNRDGKSCIMGSTYEREFSSKEPNFEKAIDEILPKAVVLIPDLANAPIIGCRSGIRVSAPGHLPLVQQVTPKLWVFTGLGSKGLLYHALYAKKLASQL